MKRIIENQLFIMSMLLLHAVSLFSAAQGYYPRNVEQPKIVYKPIITDQSWQAQVKDQSTELKKQEAPKILSGSKDDSFLPASKSVVAQEYKQQSLMLEDDQRNLAKSQYSRPVAIAFGEPIDDDFANSGLLEYSGLKHVQAEWMYNTDLHEMYTTADPETYNAQGLVIRKDFVDAQGNKHAITYDSGIETETVFDKDDHKMQQIITQADKSLVIRLYKYDKVLKKDVLQSIETRLSDGTSLFKRVYSGTMIGAEVRNKSGRVEGVTYRDDNNRIHTFTVGVDQAINRSFRDATDTVYDVAPSR